MKSIILLITFTIISFCSFGQENFKQETNRYSIDKNEQEIESTPIVVFSVFGDSGRSLIFIDTKVNIQYKLNLYKTFNITQFFANNPGEYKGQKYVLFKARTLDFDADGKKVFGHSDYLFICDIHGQNVKQISPNNLHVKSFVVNKQTNTVTYTVTDNQSSTGNLKFNPRKGGIDKLFIFNLKSESTTEIKN
jgi:hypothetical protein